MKFKKRIATVFFLILSLSFEVNAIDKDKFDQLTSLMIKGCSIGQTVKIKTSGSGGISFFKKGVTGEFEANKSEIPAIIEFLTKDEAKSDQADKTRKCMIAYMNKLFDEALSSNDKKISKTAPITIVENNVIYDFEGCHLKGRNELECKFKVASSLIDRMASIQTAKSTLFDDSSNMFTSSRATMANSPGNRNGVSDVILIADKPTTMTVFFKNIPSNLNSISRLRISVSSRTERSHGIYGILEYRDVPVVR